MHCRVVAGISGALLIMMACFAGGEALAAGRGRPKLAADLEEMAAVGPGSRLVDVIIMTEAGTQDLGPVRRRVEELGAPAGRDLFLVHGIAATLALADLPAIEDDPEVVRIAPDRPVVPAMDVAAPAAGATWTRALVSPSSVPTGRGVVVAVVDSGIYLHEDLGPDRVAASIDFIDPRRRGGDLSADPFGHGTHIAGIIAGRPATSPVSTESVLGGIAPGARLISLRVLDHRGMGRASDVIAALSWCVENRGRHGIRVVNLSLGQPVSEPAATDPLVLAVERAWEAGLVVVASAGNNGLLANGYGTVSSPGNSARALTVGAADDRNTAMVDDDAVAGFSSRGPSRFDLTLKPDLVAPGVSVVSLRSPLSTLDRMVPEARVSLDGAHGPVFEPRYFALSGSSMAAALVSGAAALMLESSPSLTPDDVKARLMRHARHDLAADVLTRGAGAVDVGSALTATGFSAGSVSPTVFAESAGLGLSGAGLAWGDAESWALEAVYGEPSDWGSQEPGAMDSLEDPCITGEGLSWQTMTSDGLSWQTIRHNGLSWQTITGGGLSWQTFKSHGLSWQTDTYAGSCPF